MNGTNKHRRAFIFTGGKGFTPEKMTLIPQGDDLIIAADSGCTSLMEFCNKVKKISPHIVLGDMDSFDKKTSLESFPDAEFLSFPPEKDDTDTALAVDTALERGCNSIVMVCGLGGRLDHTMAIVYLLEYIRSCGADAVVTDGKNMAYLASHSNTVKCGGRKYISLIPLDSKIYGVRMEGGFYYPLDVPYLERCRFLSISNELRGNTDGIITVEKGAALIVETGD